MLRYTTLENITLRLSPRLSVGDSIQFGQNAVSPDLITDQIGPQVEARMDRMLAECGVSPLSLDQYVLQGISEKLICCDVLTTYFVGQDVSDDPYGQQICDQGEAELKAACGLDSGSGEVGAGVSFSKSCTRRVTRPDAAENLKWL